jgi:LemA protein
LVSTPLLSTMWILSLEWLLLALMVFWITGVCKRMKRMRAACKTAFSAVEAQFVQLLDLLRSCANAELPQQDAQQVSLQHARHALLPSAHLLEATLIQAKQQPLRPETIAALDSAWQGVQVAWQAYVQLHGVQAQALSDEQQEWEQRWSQLITLQSHSTEQFNTAIHAYNGAIAQFPACVIARLSGLKPGRTFQKDAALLMQPPA